MIARRIAAPLALLAALCASRASAHPPPPQPTPVDPPIPPEPVPPPPEIAPPDPGQASPATSSRRADPEADPARISAEATPKRTADPSEVTGIVAPDRRPYDTLRETGNVLLFPPRESLEVLFYATRKATAIVEQQQIVPRINDFTREKSGEVTVFPTVFFDPGRKPSLGARAITGANGGWSTGVRVGTGGPNEVLFEARIGLTRGGAIPFGIVLEALHDMRTSLQYLGLGQEPERDPRNHFRETALFKDARYRDQRSRWILGFGVRPSNDVELFLSSSMTHHVIDDDPDAGPYRLTEVFEPGTVPGGPKPASPETGRLLESGRATVFYSEVAARLDTRDERSAPTNGAYTEGYGGYGVGLGADPTEYARFGLRGAAFVSIFRKRNILSPRIVVDHLAPLGKAAVVPFYELPRQPEFRGFNNRRDQLSATASLDYRWAFAPQIAARLFVDFTSVGPELAKIGPPRYAIGFGMDIFASATDLGAWAISFGPEGVAFFLSFGVPSTFGDRQHRE